MSKWLNQHIIRGFLLLGILLILLNLGRVSGGMWENWKSLKAQQPLLEKVDKQVYLLAEQDQELLRLDQMGMQQGSQTININDALDMGAYLENVAEDLAVELLTLPQVNEGVSNGYRIMEGSFQVSGTYQNIIRLAYKLEQEDRVCALYRLKLGLERYRLAGKREEQLVGELGFRMVLN